MMSTPAASSIEDRFNVYRDMFATDVFTDIVGQNLSRSITLVWLVGHGGFDDCHQCFWRCGLDGLKRVVPSFANPGEDLIDTLAIMWVSPRDNFVKHGTESIDVRMFSDHPRIAACLFRSHVCGRSHDRPVRLANLRRR